jgi:hypothetical protein
MIDYDRVSLLLTKKRLMKKYKKLELLSIIVIPHNADTVKMTEVCFWQII